MPEDLAAALILQQVHDLGRAVMASESTGLPVAASKMWITPR